MFLFIVLNLKLIPPVDEKLPVANLKYFIKKFKVKFDCLRIKKKKKTHVRLKIYAKIKTSFFHTKTL